MGVVTHKAGKIKMASKVTKKTRPRTRQSCRKREGSREAREQEEDHECEPEIDETQIVRAQEIIERLTRKYMHKIEDKKDDKDDHLTPALDSTDIPSPLKKRDEQEHSLQPTSDKENHVPNQDTIRRIRRRGKVREKSIEKQLPEVVYISPPKTRSSSRASSIITPPKSPENQSTPSQLPDTKQNSRPSFGFSKLNRSIDLSDCSNCFDYHSPSQERHIVSSTASAISKGAASMKLETSSTVAKDTKPKRQTTRKGSKSKSNNVDEMNKWIEKMNQEFDDIDNFELTIV